jgi:hypothetical protein
MKWSGLPLPGSTAERVRGRGPAFRPSGLPQSNNGSAPRQMFKCMFCNGLTPDRVPGWPVPGAPERCGGAAPGPGWGTRAVQRASLRDGPRGASVHASSARRHAFRPERGPTVRHAPPEMTVPSPTQPPPT